MHIKSLSKLGRSLQLQHFIWRIDICVTLHDFNNLEVPRRQLQGPSDTQSQWDPCKSDSVENSQRGDETLHLPRLQSPPVGTWWLRVLLPQLWLIAPARSYYGFPTLTPPPCPPLPPCTKDIRAFQPDGRLKLCDLGPPRQGSNNYL